MSVSDQFSTTVERLDNWKCQICGKVFDSEYILSYHKLLEHSENSRPPIGIA